MKFSATTGCFYPDEIAYGEIPGDAIDTTTDQFDVAMVRGPLDTLTVAGGAVVIVRYAGPTLAEAKAGQVAALNAAYQAAIVAPVAFTTAAGVSASFPQTDAAKTNLARCIDAGSAAWALNLWLDVNGTLVSPFTYPDLQGLAAAMEVAEAPDFQNLLTKIAEVQSATTISAAQAVMF